MKDWLFKAKNGDYVYAQKPNLPILVAVSAWVLKTVVFTDGDISRALEILQYCGLAIWALLELTGGVNRFRKILGAVILAIIAIILVKGVWL